MNDGHVRRHGSGVRSFNIFFLLDCSCSFHCFLQHRDAARRPPARSRCDIGAFSSFSILKLPSVSPCFWGCEQMATCFAVVMVVNSQSTAWCVFTAWFFVVVGFVFQVLTPPQSAVRVQAATRPATAQGKVVFVSDVCVPRPICSIVALLSPPCSVVNHQPTSVSHDWPSVAALPNKWLAIFLNRFSKPCGSEPFPRSKRACLFFFSSP